MSTYFKLHYHLGVRHQEPGGLLGQVLATTALGIHGRHHPRPWRVPHGVGGWVDHVHLLFDLRPTMRIPEVVRELKKASTEHIRPHYGLQHSSGRKVVASSRWAGGNGTRSRITSPGKRNIMRRRPSRRNTSNS
ncbi:MAG: transposase [Flavobacteriales bacterium]|nr:transposase [Flavobacteriales bacterium]